MPSEWHHIEPALSISARPTHQVNRKLSLSIKLLLLFQIKRKIMRNRREIPFLLHPVALKAFKAGLLSARAAPNKCHSLNVQINDSTLVERLVETLESL